MFNDYDDQSIQKNFDIKQKDRRKKLSTIWGILLAISIIIVVVLFILFFERPSNSDVWFLIPVYGGLAILTTLIGFIISMTFRSEKPYFEYLYDEVIKQINANEGLYINYKAYDKEAEAYNKNGGLFTRAASVRNYRHLSGTTDNNHLFDIYDCTMTTSSGNSTQTHFTGVYMVVKKQMGYHMQIRSNGTPKLKGMKFIRVEGYVDFRVFRPMDDPIESVKEPPIALYQSLKQDVSFKHVYISVINDEIHVALWYKKHPLRKQKKLTKNILNDVSKAFLKEIEIVNHIANIDVY